MRHTTRSVVAKYEENESAKTTVHILWIGPPATRESGTICGQDTFGASQMATDQPVNFWVLAEHVADYEEIFTKRPNIIVKPIEEAIASAGATDENKTIQAYADFVENMMSLLLNPKRNKVRDRVTIKDMMSLLLLSHYGGYVMDSNVGPANPDSPTTFYPHDKLMFPAHKTPVVDGFCMDIWLMYSPKGHARTLKSCQRLMASSEAAEVLHKETGYSERYDSALQHTIINAVLDIDAFGEPPNLEGVEYWAGIQKPGVTIIPDTNLKKYYFNTHCHGTALNQAAFFIYNKYHNALKKLLAAGDDINQVCDVDDYTNLSLVHMAILYGNQSMLKTVLSYHPDLNLKCTKKGRHYTALQLCHTKRMEPIK